MTKYYISIENQNYKMYFNNIADCAAFFCEPELVVFSCLYEFEPLHGFILDIMRELPEGIDEPIKDDFTINDLCFVESLLVKAANIYKWERQKSLKK